MAVIHADRSQGQRRAALEGFRSGQHRVLVATDIAARGIDVAEIGHVVNFDLPHVPEDYVHRIGRTARMEASGAATGRDEPLGAKRTAQHVAQLWLEAGHHERRGNRTQERTELSSAETRDGGEA